MLLVQLQEDKVGPQLAITSPELDTPRGEGLGVDGPPVEPAGEPRADGAPQRRPLPAALLQPARGARVGHVALAAEVQVHRHGRARRQRPHHGLGRRPLVVVARQQEHGPRPLPEAPQREEPVVPVQVAPVACARHAVHDVDGPAAGGARRDGRGGAQGAAADGAAGAAVADSEVVLQAARVEAVPALSRGQLAHQRREADGAVVR
mmetsp:Transcript_76448/g.224320  ORF Transcript_76448/g.224320 Transcript_76448/m.224320 type:complete len:206 (+) Transcript_76448:142-759(+)